MIFLQIAWNNMLRNRRRTLVTLSAMTLGIAVMVFANAFNAGMSQQWADSLINERSGHLQVHHKDYYQYSMSDRKRVLIHETDRVVATIRQHPHVVAVMPQAVLAGLVGNEESSVAFYGIANGLEMLDAALPEHRVLAVEGDALSKEHPDGVMLGKTLAKELGVTIGDEVIVLSSTASGDQGSALVTVRGLLQAKDNADFERSVMICGLSQQIREDLLDIGAEATNLVIRLDDTRFIPEVVTWLNQRFQEQGMPYVVEAWDNEKHFTFLTGIFNTISMIIMLILSLIVGFIISNTLLMSIFERIREVGAMRAVGMENGQVYRFFYWEYLLISSIGGALGLAAGVALIGIGQHTGVSISDGIFAEVRPVLEISNLLVSFLLPFSLTAVAALFPIRSSCRLSVVESLNYN
ncbi:hypothetical protein U14_02353 [Candidatus Moduliflexus flocculans]|uniref:ABC transporter permease n=1 Tax=Candidatus Moduliflexus flocculans TaxID=1499966 RepID=A0A0S6VUE8_9BACT|nr:hypothetical protein U14_02353 [Candidatus Moduliflexus flocculans]